MYVTDIKNPIKDLFLNTNHNNTNYLTFEIVGFLMLKINYQKNKKESEENNYV